MFILILEDEKEEKLGRFLEYLDSNEDTQYIIMEDETSAKEYIRKNSSKIDAIITDLGLPLHKDQGDNNYNIYSGIEVVSCMSVKNRRIPVLINSATELDDKSKMRLKDINYTHINNLSELYVLNPIAAENLVKDMKDKTIKVDENKAIAKASNNIRCGSIINGKFYYRNNGD